ncbi:MAG TPA: AI-2E family transporter [Saprospiraceae bacterium]|nr:AI-2E family transporter [Saprospiraceae bacterium]
MRIIRNYSTALFGLALTITALIIAKGILVPWAFAITFSLLLLPLCNFFERYLKRRILSVVLAILSALLPILGLLLFFSWQLANLGADMPDISAKIQQSINELFVWTNQQFGLTRAEGTNWLKQNVSSVLQTPTKLISEGITISGTFIVNTFLVFLYTFFLLWFRKDFRQFLVIQFKKADRKEGKEMIGRITKVVRSYTFGLLQVIGILAVLNSLGLWIIGIGYPLLWGTLAAFLAIIPYIGTTLGGLLPFLYAIATTGTYWQPIAIVAYYQLIQQIEGNFITPYVIGSNVKINPLIAILSLLIGGAIWGIPGLILSLPFAAILRIFLSYLPPFKPLAALMSDEVEQKEGIDWDELDKDKHRLIHLFSND